MKNIFSKVLAIILICILCMGNLYAYAENIVLKSVYCIDRDGRHSETFYADAVCINVAFDTLLPQNASAKLYMCDGNDEILIDAKCSTENKNILIYPNRVLSEEAEYKIKFENITVPEFTFKPVLLNEDTYFYTDFSEKKMMSLYQSGGTFETTKRESVLRGKIAKGVITNPYIDFYPTGIENEDNYVIDIKMKVNTLENGVKIQLFDGKNDENLWRVGNYIHSNGNIYTRDPLVSPYINIGSYKKGEWFTYSVAYDIKNSVSRVYLNGTLAKEIPVFGAERPNLFRLDLKNETGGICDVEIDRVRIYRGNAPISADATGSNIPFLYKWEFEGKENNINIDHMDGFWEFKDNYVLSAKAEKGVKSGACADAIAYSVQSADKYVVDTRIKVNTLTAGATVQLFDAKDEDALWRVGNYIHSNGTIYTRDPLVSPRREAGKFEKGKWFRYSVMYDVVAGQSDVYIDGVLVADNIPLYGVKRPTCFRIDLITTGDNTQADVEFDYVKIYKGDTLIDGSKQLYSYDSVMEGEMEIKHTIGEGAAYSLVSDYYIKDGARCEYPSEASRPFLNGGEVYISKEFASDILGINISGNITAKEAAQRINKEYIYDDRGFFIFADNASEYKNSSVASVIFEKSDIIYRSIVFDNPRGEKILHLLNENMAGVHPRILYTKSEIDFIKDKCNGDKQWRDALREIESGAESYLNMESQFQGDCLPGNKQNMARTFQEAVYALATAYLLTDKEIYAESAVNYINTMAMWDSMSGDVSNLVVGHWAMGMAIGYDSFYNYLSETPEGVKTLENIKNACKMTAVSEMARTYRGGEWVNRWIRINDNFSGVCSGGMMALCLSLGDEEDLKEDLIILFENLIKTQQIAVSLYYPDGGYYEGLGYGQYSLENLCISIEAMFKCFNTDFGLGRAKGFSSAGEFFTYAQSGNNAFNFHDCAEGYIYTSLPAWFYYRYQNENGAMMHRKALENYGFTPDLQTLFYLNGVNGENTNILDRYFKFTEVGTFRNSFDVRNQVFAAFHGGVTGLKHDMLDAGEFVFESDGVKWARDLGKDSYSIPGYFTTDGYKIYRKKTEGENCVVINPKVDSVSYFGQKIGGQANLLFFESNKNSAMAAYDLTDLYSRDVTSYKRGYYFGDNRNTFTIKDELSLKSGSEIYWFMNTEAEIHISGKNVTLIHGDKKLTVKINCSEEDFSVLSLPCVQLDENGKVSGQSDDSSLSKLAIYCPGAEGDVEIGVKLIPERVQYENVSPNEKIENWELCAEEENKNFYISDVKYDEANFLHATVCLPENTSSAKLKIGNKTHVLTNCASVQNSIYTDAFKGLSSGAHRGEFTAVLNGGDEKTISFEVYVPEKKSEVFYENSLKNWSGEDVITNNKWQLYSIGSTENDGNFAVVSGSGESGAGFRSQGRNASYAFKSGSAVIDFDINLSAEMGYFLFECMNTDKNWFMHTEKILNGGRNSGNEDFYVNTWYNVKAVFNFDEKIVTVYIKEDGSDNYRCIFRKYDSRAHSLLDIKLRYQGEVAGKKAYFRNFKVTREEYENRDMDMDIKIHSLKNGDIITDSDINVSAYIPFPEDGVKFILDGKEYNYSGKEGNIFTFKAENIAYGMHRLKVVSGAKAEEITFTKINFSDEHKVGNNITEENGVYYVDGYSVSSASVSKCKGSEWEENGGLLISPLSSGANSYISIGTNYQYDINRAIVFETDFKRMGNITFQLECTVNGRENGKWIYLTESEIVEKNTHKVCGTDETVGYGENEIWHHIRIIQQLKSNGAKYFVYLDGKLIKEGFTSDSVGGDKMRFASVKLNIAKYSTGGICLDNTRLGYSVSPIFIKAEYKNSNLSDEFTQADENVISCNAKQIKITQVNNILNAENTAFSVNGVSAVAEIDSEDENTLIITPVKNAIKPGEDIVIMVGGYITVLKADSDISDKIRVSVDGVKATAKFIPSEIYTEGSTVWENIRFIIASYDGDKVCAINIFEGVIENENEEYKVSLENINGGEIVKGMLWNRDNMSPVAKSVSVYLK